MPLPLRLPLRQRKQRLAAAAVGRSRDTARGRGSGLVRKGLAFVVFVVIVAGLLFEELPAFLEAPVLGLLSTTFASSSNSTSGSIFTLGSGSQSTSTTTKSSTTAAVIPIDLSVNHLQVIPFWQDEHIAPTTTTTNTRTAATVATEEDFLPIVLANDISLRWRLQAVPTSATTSDADSTLDAIRGISAYQIVAKHAHASNNIDIIIWDSGKISLPTFTPPRSVEWDYTKAPATMLKPGTILQWQVQTWDGLGQGPAQSEWSKFAIGPESDHWQAQWITHPHDLKSLQDPAVDRIFSGGKGLVSEDTCNAWKQRVPLPLARTTFALDHNNDKNNPVVSALLVASGLGMFSVTLNGKTLSSSSVHDPPLTDFSQRVSYRGFDITQELLSAKVWHERFSCSCISSFIVTVYSPWLIPLSCRNIPLASN